MRTHLAAAISLHFAALFLGAAVCAAGPITTEDLLHSQNRSDGWIQYGRNYAAWRHVPLDQINRDNVKNLKLAWQHDFDIIGGLEATALAHEGRLYVTTADSHLFCLNAADGSVFWRYDHPIEIGTQFCCGPVNRGVALAGTRVYFGTLDAHLLALDAETGNVIWNVEVGDHEEAISITGAPLVVKDMVITGIGGAEYGVRGFLDAYDLETGERRWRFWATPAPGEPGSETWGGDSWQHGGGTTWVTGTYDPELNLLYWGIGNPSPDFDGEVRPGDNLYTNAMVALNPETGALVWHFQMTPHDVFDWAGVSEGILVDEEIAGRPVKALIQANRNGYVYALDRATGALLYAKPYTKVTWADLDPNGKPIIKPEIASQPAKHVFPGRAGGRNWPPAAYSPATHLIYVPDKELGSTFIPRPAPYRKGGLYMGGSARDDPSGDGYLTAFDVRSGEVTWRFKFSGQPNWAGALSTAGGLVFAGGPDRKLRAFDEMTGGVLWEHDVPDGVFAPPISFLLDGRQVLGLAVGNNIMSGHQPEASVYMVFRLPE
jgi:alcohol dehydrogenase (cytochrome c)